MTRRIHDLSVGWTVWMPLAPVTLLLVLGIFYPEASGLLVYKEGPIEWATVVAALIGSGAGVVAFHRRGGLPTRSLRFIPILLIIGLLYIAGEESSWGQHIRHMRLPGDPEEIKNDGVPNIDPRVKGTITGDAREKVLHQLSWFKQHNDQGETNLHNLPGIWGDLFGKLPKQIIEFGSVFACVVVPLFLERKWNSTTPPNRRRGSGQPMQQRWLLSLRSCSPGLNVSSNGLAIMCQSHCAPAKHRSSIWLWSSHSMQHLLLLG